MSRAVEMSTSARGSGRPNEGVDGPLGRVEPVGVDKGVGEAVVPLLMEAGQVEHWLAVEVGELGQGDDDVVWGDEDASRRRGRGGRPVARVGRR
jgi:hypothetical protein